MDTGIFIHIKNIFIFFFHFLDIGQCFIILSMLRYIHQLTINEEDIMKLDIAVMFSLLAMAGLFLYL